MPHTLRLTLVRSRWLQVECRRSYLVADPAQVIHQGVHVRSMQPSDDESIVALDNRRHNETADVHFEVDADCAHNARELARLVRDEYLDATRGIARAEKLHEGAHDIGFC